MNELEQVKVLRKRLGWNQKELADKAEVSQSFIAKIEAGLIEPTYGKAKRILDVLHEEQGKKEPIAKEIMNRKIIFSEPEEKVANIIQKMKRHGISQVPIGDKSRIVGFISESTILENFDKNLAEKEVREIMADVPPIVALDTPRKVILELLKVFQIVLVGNKGEIQGIVSKADILGKIS